MTEVFAALKRNPLLGVLPSADLRGLAAEGTQVSVLEGTCLVREGDAPITLWLILSGEVSAGGPLGMLRPDELIGAEEMLAGQLHGCSYHAIQPVEAFRLPAEVLRTYLETHFNSAIAMISAMAGHLRNQVREITELKMQSTAERLASYLLQLAGDATGRTVVRLPCEKRHLADTLGMDPATLSRAFAKLREKGVKANRSDKVVISDVALLRRYGDCAALSA